MAIERAKATRRRTCLQAGATRRTAGGEFLVPRGMTLSERQGKKVASPPLRLRRSRRSRPSARSSHKRGCVGRVGSDSILNKENWRGSDHPRKKSGVQDEGKVTIGSKRRGVASPSSCLTTIRTSRMALFVSRRRSSARWKRRRASQIFGVAFAGEISSGSAFRRRVAASSPIPGRRHAGDMIQACRKPLFEVGRGVETDARPGYSTHHDGADQRKGFSPNRR